jgi:abequosyltransferase
MTPLLSVCLPTYNQPESIRNLLEKLLLQYRSDIEILIRDDSPNELTKRVVEEYQHKIPIRFFCGTREGLDSAIIFLTEQARGDFIWWIGDDVLLDDAIKEVMSVLLNYPSISFLWVNSTNIFDSKKLTVNNTNSEFFKSRNDIFKLDVGLLGFITATIFKREIALNSLSLAKRHVGSAFVCLFIILYVITRGNQYYYIGRPCFASYPKPSGEIRWYNQIQVFGINLTKIVNEFIGELDNSVVSEAISRNLTMVLRAIIVERAKGLETGFAANYPVIIPFSKLYWKYKAFYIYLPLLIMPKLILKMCYTFLKLIRSLRDKEY